MKGVLLSAAVLVAAVAATVVSALKGRRWFLAYGLAISVLAGWQVGNAISLSGDDLSDLFLFLFLFMFIGPLCVVVIIGAAGTPRPGSWWARRFPHEPRDPDPPLVGEPRALDDERQAPLE